MEDPAGRLCPIQGIDSIPVGHWTDELRFRTSRPQIGSPTSLHRVPSTDPAAVALV